MAPSSAAGQRHPHRRQRGAALLLFMLIVVIGASYMLLTRLNASSIRTQNTTDSVEALKAAKEALLGYAASYPDQYGATNPEAGPGHLPCPDTDGNGSPNTPCGPGALKWLPTRKLGLDDLRDGSGARLWYAIGDGFRNNPMTTPFNTVTVDAFPPSEFLSADGADDIVAVILAPGEPLDTQDRTSGPGAVSNYLEGENSNGDTIYSSDVSGGNDLIAVITRAELMAVVEKRVLGEVSNELEKFYSGKNYYPYAALLGSSSTPPNRFGWKGLREGFLPLDGGKGEWECACEPRLQPIGIGVFRWFDCSCQGKSGNTVNRKFTLESPTSFVNPTGSCILSAGSCICDIGPGDSGGCSTTPQPVPGPPLQPVTVKLVDGIFNEVEDDCSLIQTDQCACSGPGEGKCKARMADQGASATSPPLNLPQWFEKNHWDQLVYYRISRQRSEAGGGGLLQVGSGVTDAGALVIASGPELGSTNCNGSASHDQRGNRPSRNVCDYLDSQENTDGDDVYTDRSTPMSGSYWDRIRIVKP